MSLNFAAVGREFGPELITWTPRDVMLYALGVGAGQVGPFAELQFTSENTRGLDLQTLPTFGIMQAARVSSRPSFGDFPATALLHGEQSITVHRPLAPNESALASFEIEHIYDMGSGALMVARSELRDPTSNELILQCRASYFIRGEGGFGGARPQRTGWDQPARVPDHVVSATVRADQPLLYRLSGDPNPLHSDPAVAAEAGFPRPILHGLCTYGITARCLVHALCGGEASRLRAIEGRFTKPVLPGTTLSIRVWGGRSGTASFQTVDAADDVVLDRGRCDYLP